MSGRYPGCHFRIWKPLEALLGCIDRSFIKNDDWWHFLRIHSQSNHNFLRKFSFLLYYATRFIGFDSADCPYTIILSAVDRIYVQQLLIWEQNLHRVLSFRKRVRTQFENFFSFLFILVGSTIFSYGPRSRSFFNIPQTPVREIFSWIGHVRWITFFFRFFTF